MYKSYHYIPIGPYDLCLIIYDLYVMYMVHFTMLKPTLDKNNLISKEFK
jgi:hypothetical protein